VVDEIAAFIKRQEHALHKPGHTRDGDQRAATRILYFATAERKSLPAEYNKPGHVAPEVVDHIAAFVKR